MRECREHGQAIAKLWANNLLLRPTELRSQALEQTPQVNPRKVEEVQLGVQQDQPHPEGCQCMICTVCNWVYDPSKGEPNQGIEPGTVWSDIPDYFLCPECHLGKDVFVEYKA